MPRHSTYRSRGAADPVGGEWSSGQLGIGIAVAVVFGLVCFILGYVVANVDRPLQTANTTPAASAGPGGAATNSATRPEGSASASETSTSGTARETGESTSGLPKASPSRPPESTTRVNPGARPVEPLPSPGGPTPMTKSRVNIGNVGAPASDAGQAERPEDRAPIIPPGGSETAPPKPAGSSAPETVARATSVPAGEAADAPPAAPTPVKAPPEPVETPATTPTAATPNPPAGAPTVRRGAYGVQVAAFDGPRRSEQANEARKKLKAATGLDAEIVTSTDGDWEKVIVTGYSDPDDAKDQCEMLKEKPGYASAWVVRLP